MTLVKLHARSLLTSTLHSFLMESVYVSEKAQGKKGPRHDDLRTELKAQEHLVNLKFAQDSASCFE